MNFRFSSHCFVHEFMQIQYKNALCDQIKASGAQLVRNSHPKKSVNRGSLRDIIWLFIYTSCKLISLSAAPTIIIRILVEFLIEFHSKSVTEIQSHTTKNES